jgi:hypothetical protein
MSWSLVPLARRMGVAIGLVALALVVAGAAGATGARCDASGTSSPNVGRGDNYFLGVAATSACNAWAVGDYLNSKRTVSRTLIEHWNGKAWKVQASPNPSKIDSELYGVAATSAKNAWAVGIDCSKSACRTLVEHWNGKAWKAQASPSPSPGSQLRAITAISAKNAWAVGYFAHGSVTRTLIEHWNGKAWKVRPSPDRGGPDNDLEGVAASSPSNAWAVGRHYNGTSERTLIEHWNGKAWKVQPSPNAGSSADANEPNGVVAISPTKAWVVGDVFTGTVFHTLVERWNGKAWKVESIPHRGSSYALDGVAAVSSADVWAVGNWDNGTDHALIEHWNGKTWRMQPSYDPSPYVNRLAGVAAISPTDAWAVGLYFTKAAVRRTLTERWNGNAWKR